MLKSSVNDSSRLEKVWSRSNPSDPWGLVYQEWSNSPDNITSAGSNTPNFRELKRKGELLPFTPWIQVQNKTKSQEFDLRYVISGVEYWYDWKMPSEGSGSILNLQNMNMKRDELNPPLVMQEAASRVVSSGWDVLTFAAEVAQTVDMFLGVLTKVRNLANSKPVGTPWGTWLEARYGWRTLAYDIDDIEKAFSKIQSRKFSTASAGQSINWEENTSDYYNNYEFRQDIYKRVEYNLNARGKVVIKGDLPKINVNILKTAWEVTRLSFVIDWFINVGRLIDALQLSLTLDYRAGFGTRLEVNRHTWREFSNFHPDFVHKSSNTVKSHVWAEGVTREPASISLLPLVSVKLDTFKVFDLVSLLIQSLRR